MKTTFILFGATALVGGALVVGCGDDSGEGGSTSTTTGTNAGPTGGTPSSNTATTGNSTGNGSGSTTSTGQASSSTSAAGGMFDCNPSDGSSFELTREEVGNYSNPILVTFAPGDMNHIYIVEKTGTIVVNDGTNDVGTFLDVSSLITDSGEQGLLGLAFHPDYAQNGRFFVHYSSEQGGESTIEEYKRSQDPLVADPTGVQIVLTSPTAQSNHNGGMIAFGPDGFLYINLGDGGQQGDPECDAQIFDSADGGDPDVDGPNYLGKIMRVDVNAAPDANGYPAAAGNPNGHKAYHIGFRNPWRSSFDACTGDLYVGDVGQNAWEEVSVVTQAEGPRNFGWPYREANTNYGADACPNNPGNLLEPILQYNHGQGCSIVGGYVYRGAEIPGLRGTYFYADTCAGTVWTATKNGADWTSDTQPALMSDNPGGYNYTSFGQDAQGNLYITDINGPVYRIVAQ